MMHRWSQTRPIVLGLCTLLAGVGGFAVWASTTRINGAVVAPGRIEVEARRQVIQHPDGGLVEAITAREGDAVSAGAPLLRLDGSELEAQRLVLTRSLHETRARMDRLKAEALDLGETRYSDDLLDLARQAPDLAQVLAEESALFHSRRETMAQTLAQLAERSVQADEQINGFAGQVGAYETQLSLIEVELINQRNLLDLGLTQSAKVSALERESAGIRGEIGRLTAAIAEVKSQKAGFEIERLRLAAQRREEAQDQLRQLQPEEVTLRENLRIVTLRLGRLVLRAPMAGRVLDLKVHTVGGVIGPGSEVAAIVPGETPLVFVVRIDPYQIDRLQPGQSATVRFPNFDSRITPTFLAIVERISADTVTDRDTGATYYTAELSMTEETGAILSGYDLQPGMPLEAFIQTGMRTPASFLLKPVSDYLSYAFRDK